MNIQSPRLRVRSRKKRCYELSFRGQSKAPKWTLVHGTIIPPDGPPDFRYGHAWLEFDGQAYDAVLDAFFPVDVYYRERCVTATKRFTAIEAAERAATTNMYGPWD